MLEEGRPIFVQIAERIEGEVLDGSLPEESQVPSTNELAAFHRINPATAAKGVNALVLDGILYKRRGVGMFVSTGARDKLLARRRAEFQTTYVVPLLDRARQLGIDEDHVVMMIKATNTTATTTTSTTSSTNTSTTTSTNGTSSRNGGSAR